MEEAKSVRFELEGLWHKAKTAYFADEDLWNKALDAAKTTLEFQKETWRHEYAETAHQAKAQRDVRKRVLANREAEIRATAAAYPVEQQEGHHAGLRWQRSRVSWAKDGRPVFSSGDGFAFRPSSRASGGGGGGGSGERTVPQRPARAQPQRSPDGSSPNLEAGHSKHRRHRKLTRSERARKEYEMAKQSVREVIDNRLLFDGDMPHDTDGDLDSDLGAREQRDELPETGTAHGNFRSEGRLTLHDEQLSLESTSRRNSRERVVTMTSPPLFPSDSTETVNSEHSQGVSVESSKHPNDDGTLKNHLTAHGHANEQKSAMPPVSTLKEMNDILEQKALADTVDELAGNAKTTLKDFVHEYYLNKYGLRKMAVGHTAKFLLSVMHHDQMAIQLHMTNVLKTPQKKDGGHATASQCSCGNHFLTDSTYCRKCGSLRPGCEKLVPPLEGPSTNKECGCGSIFKGDSKFCRSCGRERLKMRPTREQCGCGNLFLTDSMYCRRCGQKRPGNFDPAPLRSGESTHLFCACKTAFVHDAVFCRKCGSPRPEEPPHWRFSVFLYAVGMKSKRFMDGPLPGEMLSLMLRRAFSKKIKSMSERLGNHARLCLIPLELAIQMVIGLDAKRNDNLTWDAPQLASIGIIHDIQTLLEYIEGLRKTRNGQGIVCVDIDEVLLAAMNAFVRCGERNAAAFEKLKRKKKIEEVKKEQEEKDAESMSFDIDSNLFVDYDGLLSEDDTVMSQLNDPNDNPRKVEAINNLRARLGEDMGAFFTISQTCMVRRAVQEAIEGYMTEVKLEQGTAEVEIDEALLPIDERAVGSARVLSVSQKTTGMARTITKKATIKAQTIQKLNTGITESTTKKRTTIFGWSAEKREESLARTGVVRIVGAHTGEIHNTSFDGFNHYKSDTTGAPNHDLVRGTAKDFHSALLYDTFREMNLSGRSMHAVPHRRACAAYLDECARLGIVPKPILDHFSPVSKEYDYGEDEESDELCQCGSYFMENAIYCSRCGTKKPDVNLDGVMNRRKAIIGRNTFLRCQCGHEHATDAKFCLKCGLGRILVKANHIRCGCLNYFLLDFKFCQICGTSRPALSSGDKSAGETMSGSSPKKGLGTWALVRKHTKGTHITCHCGNHFRADSKYCPNCGTKRPRIFLPPEVEERLVCVKMPGMAIGERGGIALGRCLSVLDLYLHEIDLSNNGLHDGAIYEILKTLERQTHVVRLNLSGNTFKVEASKELVKLLTTTKSQHFHSLWRVKYQQGDYDDPGSHLCDNLKDLKLNSCSLTSGSLQAVMNALSEHHIPKLHSIDLARNDLSRCEDALGLLVEANLPNLTYLNISWTGVGSHEALSMAKALEHNKSILKLDLSLNNFGGINAMYALSESLRNNQTLTYLDISHNQMSEASACVAAHGMISSSNALKHVHMNGNSVGVTGGREIICETCHNPRSREVSLEGCSFESGIELSHKNDDGAEIVTDLMHFNKEFPDGPYELDLQYKPARQVAVLLMKYAPLQQAIPGRDCFKNVTLNRKSYHDLGYCGDGSADKSYKLPLKRLVTRGEDEVYETSEGELPERGILKFRYVMQKTMEHRHLSEDRFDYLLDQIKHAALDKEDGRLVRAFVTAAAMEFSFTCQQARALLDYSEGVQYHIETIALFLAKIRDKENLSILLSKLNQIDQRQAERKLGDFYYFNPLNTTGHYRLHLNNKWDRLLLVELTAVNRKERSICRKEGRPDLSEFQNYEYLRNCTYTSTVDVLNPNTGKTQRKLVREDMKYRNTWEIPPTGIFECDYVSPIRPPDDAGPAEEGGFEAFIRECVNIKMVEADISEEELRELFEAIDADGGGTLDADELKVVFMQLGHILTTDEVKDLISQVDEGGGSKGSDASGDGEDDEDEGDGEVDFSEFRALWDLFNHEIALRERLSTIRNSSIKFWVEADQLARILSYFHTPKERVEIYVIFYSRLLDEENMHKALALMGGELRPMPERPNGGKKVQKQFKNNLKRWEQEKAEWDEQRKLELDELKRRLGPLCLFNPCEPDGDYLLPLGSYDSWLVACMLIKIAANEGPGKVLSRQFYGAKNADMGFELREEWINEGPPRIGYWMVTFTSPHRRTKADFLFRMDVCKDYLGWEFPDDELLSEDSSSSGSSSGSDDIVSQDGDDELQVHVSSEEKLHALCPFSKYLQRKGNVERSTDEVVSVMYDLYVTCCRAQEGFAAEQIHYYFLSYFRDCEDEATTDEVAEERLAQFLEEVATFRFDDRRILLFSKLIGLRGQERFFCSLSWELVQLLLSRAFDGDMEEMSEAFRRELVPRVPLKEAIAMIIGDEASRHPPDDTPVEEQLDGPFTGHRDSWACPQLWEVANDAQIENLIVKIEELKKVDMSTAARQKRVLLNDVFDLVMEKFFECYEKVSAALMEGWERQKLSSVGLEEFITIMKDLNVEFQSREVAMMKWVGLKAHVGMASESGIGHPELFATGVCQLRMLPKFPKFGSIEGHKWYAEKDKDEVQQSGDSDADELRNELMQMLRDGDIVAKVRSGDTDSSSSDESGDDFFDEGYEGGNNTSTGVAEAVSTMLFSGATVEKKKDDKRRMSFLWGRPLEISDAVQNFQKAVKSTIDTLPARAEQSRKKRGKRAPVKKDSGKRRKGIVAKMKRKPSTGSGASRGKSSSKKTAGRGSKAPSLPLESGDASVVSARSAKSGRSSKSTKTAAEATAIGDLLSSAHEEPAFIGDAGILNTEASPSEW